MHLDNLFLLHNMVCMVQTGGVMRQGIQEQFPGDCAGSNRIHLGEEPKTLKGSLWRNTHGKIEQ